jgi:hypothetical protein
MNAVKHPDKQQQKSVPKYSENIELNHRTMNRMHYFCEMLYNTNTSSSLSLSEIIMKDATKYGLGQIRSIDQFFVCLVIISTIVH